MERSNPRGAALLGLALGASLAALVLPRGRAYDAAAGQVALWALDAGAGRVIGLDARDLSVREGPGPPAPAGLGWVDPDGAAWSCAPEPGLVGWTRVRRAAPPGSAGPRLDARLVEGHVRAGTALAGGLLLALDEGREPRVVWLAPAADGLAVTTWLAGTPVTALAAEARPDGTARLLVARPDGTLEVFERAARTVLRARRRLAAGWSGLAPGPDLGWWALSAGARPALLSLSRELGVRAERATRPGRERLATSGGAPWAWVVDGSGAGAQRIGARGEILARASALPVLEVRAAAALPTGELLVAGTGALITVASDGRPIRSQGGWERLAALAIAGGDAAVAASPGSAEGSRASAAASRLAPGRARGEDAVEGTVGKERGPRGSSEVSPVPSPRSRSPGRDPARPLVLSGSVPARRKGDASWAGFRGGSGTTGRSRAVPAAARDPFAAAQASSSSEDQRSLPSGR